MSDTQENSSQNLQRSIDLRLKRIETQGETVTNAPFTRITDGIDTLLIDSSGNLIPGAGENHIGEVGGSMITVGVEKTRPADANAYAVNDVINESTSAGTVWTFTNLARANSESGYIVKARLVTDQKANVAQYRIHLYSTAPTAIFDNVANTLLYADNSKKIGQFDLVAMGTEDAGTSTGAITFDTTLRIPYVCANGSRTIYAVLETLTIFTPASSQKYYLELTSDNN